MSINEIQGMEDRIMELSKLIASLEGKIQLFLSLKYKYATEKHDLERHLDEIFDNSNHEDLEMLEKMLEI